MGIGLLTNMEDLVLLRSPYDEDIDMLGMGPHSSSSNSFGLFIVNFQSRGGIGASFENDNCYPHCP